MSLHVGRYCIKGDEVRVTFMVFAYPNLRTTCNPKLTCNSLPNPKILS